MKTLVLGLGNPILSDDGVGPSVVRELEGRFDPEEVVVMEASVGGLGLVDLLAGFDTAVIIDSVQTVGGKAGQIYRLDAEAFDSTRYASSPHDVNFAAALEFGRRVGLALPRRIVVFAIEVADVHTFNERCTLEVSQAVPVAVELVVQEVNGGSDAHPGDGPEYFTVRARGSSKIQR